MALFVAGLVLTILFFILSTISLSHAATSGESSDTGDTEGSVEAEGHDLGSDQSMESDHSIETEDTFDADHSVEVDHGVEIDHSVEVEHNFESNHTVQVEAHAGSPDTHEISSETETGAHTLDTDHVDINSDTDDGVLTLENKTPITLIFSLYILWFGAIGVFSYDIILEKYLWLTLVVLIPIAISKIISLAWHRIARNLTYRVSQEMELLGKRATVKVEITEEGGTIAIQSAYYVHQVPAKSFYPMAKFYPGEEVFIWDFKDGFYLVDSHPRTQRKQNKVDTKKIDKEEIDLPVYHDNV